MMNSTDRPKRILIAEDDPSISHLLSMQLEADGYEIMSGRLGATATIRIAGPGGPRRPHAQDERL